MKKRTHIKLFEEYTPEPPFYMGMCYREDGKDVFDIQGKRKTHVEGMTMYAFFPTGPDKATFKIISDEEVVKYFKNSYIDNFKPACLISWLPERDTSDVINIKDGTAFFNGKDWEVKTQCEIGFLPKHEYIINREKKLGITYNQTPYNPKEAKSIEPKHTEPKSKYKTSFTISLGDESLSHSLDIEASNEEEAKSNLLHLIKKNISFKSIEKI